LLNKEKGTDKKFLKIKEVIPLMMFNIEKKVRKKDWKNRDKEVENSERKNSTKYLIVII
jgi:hypothetical protein